MTDSIQRFQREATQRERLSSLGRLSTVVAHEIRNPLMIIKTALRTLRQETVASRSGAQRATRDIDEEIARLNLIVTEVLDFARPIKFELAPADINALATDAVRAAAADGTRPAVQSAPRSADSGGRHRPGTAAAGPGQRPWQRDPGGRGPRRGRRRHDAPIRLETARLDSERVTITVRDRGTGITAENLAHVFDPYFTTRRTGTGIGLAISRNIVEGLGGRITVASQPERGTEVRIELPLHSTAA